jgi:tetratricopeptide (TPR) repeat protein
LVANGEEEEGLKLLLRAHAAAVTVFGPDHPRTAWRASGQLSTYLLDAGRYAEAEPMLKQALRTYDALPLQDRARWQTYFCANALGRLYLETGRIAEAEPLLKRAVDECMAVYKTDSSPFIIANLAILLGNLGALYHQLKRPSDAEATFASAFAVLQKGPANMARTWRLHFNYAGFQADQGQLTVAVAHYDAALSQLRVQKTSIAARYIVRIEASKRIAQLGSFSNASAVEGMMVPRLRPYTKSP